MIRKLLKPVYLHLWVLPRIHRTYKSLSLAETFQRIYRTKSWGDSGEPFSSGFGSRGPISEQYSAAVIEFIRSHQVQSVVDLGCGDFVVGNRIVEATSVRYTGLDVVPELIEYHKSHVHNHRVNFACADITSDPLPSADLYLLRQVLQHLSNDEIAKVLGNLGNSPFTLISEDVPVHPKSFNRDKPHGPDVRSSHGSGVYVDEPPFSSPVAESWIMPLLGNSMLRTVLIDRVESRSSNKRDEREREL